MIFCGGSCPPQNTFFGARKPPKKWKNDDFWGPKDPKNPQNGGSWDPILGPKSPEIADFGVLGGSQDVGLGLSQGNPPLGFGQITEIGQKSNMCGKYRCVSREPGNSRKAWAIFAVHIGKNPAQDRFSFQKPPWRIQNTV